jgi:N-acetylglutamate synthase-like GNAT family acetyltransferase
VIRLATKADSFVIVKLLQACHLYNPALDYSEWSFPTIVYVADNMVVGMCQMILAKPYAYLSEICVHPDYQHRDIGTAMLKHMEKIIHDFGIKSFECWVHDDNTDIHTAARTWGATPVGHGTGYMKNVS